MRRAATTSLSALIEPPDAVTEHLIRALDDEDGGTRRIAALALGELGERHPKIGVRAEPALIRVGRGEDANLCRAAARSLARIARHRDRPASPSASASESGDPRA